MEDSRYWLDILCQQLTHKYQDKKIVIASGATPSGPYHVGHIKEIFTADAIRLAMDKLGYSSYHIHFIDSFDTLRKRYPYLPKSYEEQVGKPLYLIPSMDKKAANYAQGHFAKFSKSLPKLGIDKLDFVWMHKVYQQGKMAKAISIALKNRQKIAKILNKISVRKLDENWWPIQISDKSTNSLRTAKFISYDEKLGLVSYLSQDGNKYQADINKGEIKLDWRLDWLARWYIYDVDIEPFGREHASAGGSWDTSKVIAKEIYGIEPPIPVAYENIHLKGDSKKMSSSVGNLVSIEDALKIIPPEILRYFVLKSRPEKQLSFDPGIGIYNLIDEFAKVAVETADKKNPQFEQAYELSVLVKDKQTVSKIPFSHLVTCYQSAQGNIDETFVVLERTGYGTETKSEPEVIKRQLKNVDYWLKNYAPDNVKFALQKKLPKLDLSINQKQFLASLADLMEKDKNLSAQAIHDAIYNIATKFGIKPAEAFKTIYYLFLAQDSGPKAGFFLVTLKRDFVIRRLRLKD
ncbi:MAG: lysine--tRNA ligase [bacterium]|nr:lysine--tRNA ligase [bacterium]